MRRSSIVLSLLCGVVFLAVVGSQCIPQLSLKRGGNQSSSLAPFDQNMQRRIVDQDVHLTKQLQLSQTFTNLQRIANTVPQQIDIHKSLTQEKIKYPQVDMLSWITREQTEEKDIIIGQFPHRMEEKLRPLFHQAKQKTMQGKVYVSDSVGEGSAIYQVIGLPSSFERSALLAVIHQDVLHQVKNYQEKNMRLQAFPHEMQSHIKTIPPNTSSENQEKPNHSIHEKSHYVEHELVVRFRNDPSLDELNKIKADIDARDVKKVGYTYVFTAKSMTTKQLEAYFNTWPIVYLEPHYVYITNQGETPQAQLQLPDASFQPNDQFFAKYQWNLPQIHTINGWQFNRGTAEIVVAVVDTGVDLQHPDLQSQLVAGMNLLEPKQPPQDDLGHGTHVSGIISAQTNNDLGVAGISWFNKIMPIKVLNQEGAGSTYTVAQGIIWATDHGAKVINLSLGNYADSAFLRDAVQYAFDHDVVMVAASGNDHTDRPSFPAAYPQVFAVAASDANKQAAPFSNFGDYVDVTAPGVSIASTYIGQEYAALSGTSMASPHVAALAALIRSTNPSLTNAEVYDLMRNTAVDLGATGKDPAYGYGLIDIERALEASYYDVMSIKKPQSEMLCE